MNPNQIVKILEKWASATALETASRSLGESNASMYLLRKKFSGQRKATENLLRDQNFPDW